MREKQLFFSSFTELVATSNALCDSVVRYDEQRSLNNKAKESRSQRKSDMYIFIQTKQACN